MDNTIKIKSYKNGLRIILDPDIEFSLLKEKAIEKFNASSKFLGDAKLAVVFEERDLSEQEEKELLDIISYHTDLDIVCIVKDDPDIEQKFVKSLNEKLMDLNSRTGQFFKGNLRSGQVLETETSVIILGDVNPGASVVSTGNIVVIGALKGTAFAGATGNESAFVLALELNPVQIRIADTIARAPDASYKEEIKESRIAFLEDGNIYIEPINKKVLNDIQL